jgi:Terminase large subunit, T4likevirus-type, N-terminal
MNILEAMQDGNLFGKIFHPHLPGDDTWASWRAFLAALFGHSLDDGARELYRRHTGRTDGPGTQFAESFVIAGRRSGKSLIAATVAVFLACFRDYRDILAPGETATVMILAADRRQARVILGYVNGFFDSIPVLARMVTTRMKESIELSNRVRIEIHTSSFRAVRGYSIAAAILDELAFWPSDDSANPDTEVLTALRPAMATVPGALLLGISSPYARRGVLWEAYKENFGKTDSPVLVWKAATREMNPTVSSSLIEAAYLRDPVAASAEYGAEFRTDIEGFLSLDVIEPCVVPNRGELPPLGSVSYAAFVDPSGGSSDSMTLAIAHRDRGRAVLDLLREIRAPFSPESAVQEFAATLKRYRIFTVSGDRYAGEWPREQFQKLGIHYRTSEKTRSELYLELLPALTSGQAELLDNKRLISQLAGLERRTSRLGKDSVDHSPGAHDDVANAAAGALVEALGREVVLGLVEWQKNRAAETGKGKAAAEEAVACPACNSTAVVTRGDLKHCNMCAHEWGWPAKTAVGGRQDVLGNDPMADLRRINASLTPNRFCR